MDTSTDQSFSACAVYRSAAWTAHNAILDRNYNSRQVEQVLDGIMARCKHFIPGEDPSGKADCDGIDCNAWWCLAKLAALQAGEDRESTANAALPDSERTVHFKEPLSTSMEY
jgi:hypothetical protein